MVHDRRRLSSVRTMTISTGVEGATVAKTPGPSHPKRTDQLPNPLTGALSGPDVAPPSLPPGEHFPEKVGCRLQGYWQVWRRKFPSSPVWKQLRDGIRWKFLSLPPLSNTPVTFPNSPLQRSLLQTAVEGLLRKGAVEVVPSCLTPGFYSRLFLRPKPTGELRPIIDLSRLNELIVCPSFKMETAHSIQTALQEGEWTFQIDIKDAYLHIPIKQNFRKYLRFVVNGQVYQFR